MYKKDSNVFSLFWGRMGAAILLGIATLLSGYGYIFELEDQQMVYDVIASIFAGIAFIQVTVSKIRENKKVQK